MAKRESAKVIRYQEKEITKIAFHASENLSLYSKKLKEYFKKKRIGLRKDSEIYVCYIVGIILAVSGMVSSFGLVGFSVVILISDTAVIILGSVQVYFLWNESISTKILEASKCTELISYMCISSFV